MAILAEAPPRAEVRPAPAPTVKPGRKAPKGRPPLAVSLCLAIDHQAYSVTPIKAEDPTVIRAWRLVKLSDRDAVYDVAETFHGASCSCPDHAARREGLDEAGCKHYKALVMVGLLDAPNAAVEAAIRAKAAVVQAAPCAPPNPRDAWPARFSAPLDFDPAAWAELPPVAGGAPATELCCPAAEPEPCAACVPPAAADVAPAAQAAHDAEYLAVADVMVAPEPAAPALASPPEPADRLDLVGAIEAQAAAYEAQATEFGRLIGETLRALAEDVWFLGSPTPAQYRRDSALARARDYDQIRRAEDALA